MNLTQKWLVTENYINSHCALIGAFFCFPGILTGILKVYSCSFVRKEKTGEKGQRIEINLKKKAIMAEYGT